MPPVPAKRANGATATATAPPPAMRKANSTKLTPASAKSKAAPAASSNRKFTPGANGSGLSSMRPSTAPSTAAGRATHPPEEQVDVPVHFDAQPLKPDTAVDTPESHTPGETIEAESTLLVPSDPSESRSPRTSEGGAASESQNSSGPAAASEKRASAVEVSEAVEEAEAVNSVDAASGEEEADDGLSFTCRDSSSMPKAGPVLSERDADGKLKHYHHAYPSDYEYVPDESGKKASQASAEPRNHCGLTAVEKAKLAKQEEKYRKVAQKIFDRCGATINGDAPHDIVVHNPLFYRRVLKEGSMGLGESFMEGWWDCNSELDTFFCRLLKADLEHYLPDTVSDFSRVLTAKVVNMQTVSRSLKVGRHHYDTSNELFEKMLDPFMQYSCGVWWNKCGVPNTQASGLSAVEVPRHGRSESDVLYDQIRRCKTLNEAQENKLHLIAQKLKLKEGMRVLDVGCGWGGLAKFLATHYKVKVTGITISKEQLEYAQQLCAGLDVEIIEIDYRNLKAKTEDEKYDRIVSVGMFEHVGPKNYKVFFSQMREVLKEDTGIFLLHTIGAKVTMESADPWYLKYIFPGGCLPSVSNMSKAFEKRFILEDWHNFGPFYDDTLMAWRQNFVDSWSDLEISKRPESFAFYRMFYYYLSSCAGAFRSRDLQLWQVVLTPKGYSGYMNVSRP